MAVMLYYGYNHTRRKSLKVISGAISMASIGIVGGSSTPSDTESETKLVTGTPDDPVTKNAVNTVQKKVSSQSISTLSDQPVIPFGEPKWDLENTYVSFYAVKTDKQGKPITHIGYSSSNERYDEQKELEIHSSSRDEEKTVDKERRRAQQVKQAIEAAPSANEYRDQVFDNSSDNTLSTNSASTNSISGIEIGNDWESFGVVNAERRESEGNLFLTAQPSVYLGPSNADGDLWSAIGNYIIEPEVYTDTGAFLHGTEQVKVEQDFGDGIPDVKSVGATAPSGDKSERVTGKTVSLSADTSGDAGGSISWTYSQPKINRYEKTNTSGDRNEAAWLYNTTADSDDERLQFRLGSNHWLEDAPGCSEEDSNLRWNMGETELRGVFDHIYRTEDTYEIGANWFGWVCP